MALYLGKDKIASNGTITGDTLPVGTIVEYDGTEVPANWELFEGEEGAGIPEINQNEIILTELEDGLYKCTYQTMYGSPEEKTAAEGNPFMPGLVWTHYCYLYKQHPDDSIGGIVTGRKYAPFTVRLIETGGDTIISVDGQGMSTSQRISTYRLEQMDTKITTLETSAKALTNKMTLIDMLNGSFLSRTDRTITPGMTWNDLVADEDFLNFDGSFSIMEDENRVLHNYFDISYDNGGIAPVYPDDIIRDGGIYYTYRTGDYQ